MVAISEPMIATGLWNLFVIYFVNFSLLSQ